MKRLLVIVLMLGFSMLYTEGIIDHEISALIQDCPLKLPVFRAPVFPDQWFHVDNYGAVGDGLSMNTKAFSKAIQACAEAGGGHVVVPSGIWLTGAIKLKSNVNLHVEQGGVILFSDRYADFPLIETHWEGERAVRATPPIYGYEVENIAITGEGIIDGSGHIWRPVKKFKMTERQWLDLLYSGGVLNEQKSIWWPTENALKGPEILQEIRRKEDVTLSDYSEIHAYLRPVMIGLVRCKHVLLDGPTFQNSPAWSIHPLMSENVIVRNINVRNPWYSQNGDGLDVESCKNVVIYNSRFDVGDDAICIKSGKNAEGRRRGLPSENIVVSDCVVYHGHGGFVVGSEMSGSVRNISVQNCTFIGTDVGLRFKSKRGRGGVVENIFIDHILMKDIPTDAIRFNMYYDYQAPIPDDGSSDQAGEQSERAAMPVSEETPRFQKISMSNITCIGAKRAVLLQGLPEMPIHEIALKNILIKSMQGLTCIDADQIDLSHILILTDKGPVFRFDNSRNVYMEDIDLSSDADPVFDFRGEKTRNIHFRQMQIKRLKNRIRLAPEVSSDAIIYPDD